MHRAEQTAEKVARMSDRPKPIGMPIATMNSSSTNNKANGASNRISISRAASGW